MEPSMAAKLILHHSCRQCRVPSFSKKKWREKIQSPSVPQLRLRFFTCRINESFGFNGLIGIARASITSHRPSTRTTNPGEAMLAMRCISEKERNLDKMSTRNRISNNQPPRKTKHIQVRFFGLALGVVGRVGSTARCAMHSSWFRHTTSEFAPNPVSSRFTKKLPRKKKTSPAGRKIAWIANSTDWNPSTHISPNTEKKKVILKSHLVLRHLQTWSKLNQQKTSYPCFTTVDFRFLTN